MTDTPIIMREQQYGRIITVLGKLRLDSFSRVVFLVDKNGQEIAVGERGHVDEVIRLGRRVGRIRARLRVVERPDAEPSRRCVGPVSWSPLHPPSRATRPQNIRKMKANCLRLLIKRWPTNSYKTIRV